MVVVQCEQVWEQISDYIDGDVDAGLRSALDDHIQGCQRCNSVLNGTRNIVHLYGDDRLFKTPMGYSWRLQRRIQSDMQVRRRTVLGWLAATAALAVITGSIAIADKMGARSFADKSPMAQIGRVPADLEVVVTDHGKLFHVKECPFIREKDHPHAVTAAEAETQGYVPCVRCLGQYVGELAARLLNRGSLAEMIAAK
jgi:predicted anti-sigma-YlaC factor YlaD